MIATTRRCKQGLIAAVSLGITVVSPETALADNPIVQTLYTADPAPMVHDGTLYLYTTHDEDVTVDDFFTMNDWRVYSSTDVVNWTDHGSPLHYSAFGWASGDAWAGQTVYRNGTFYFYVPITRSGGGSAIGVATSDSPIGPFEDALGSPLITSNCGDIDPTVFIDDDAQAYLYWGNPNLCYVKLNEDMISYQGEIVEVPLTTASFGTRSDTERPTTYEEGPWFYKREGLYYLVFAAGPISEHIGYSTSTSPTGPWSYGGVVMPTEGGSFTNHPGVVDYKGKSLFFYHSGALPGGGGFKRSVCVEEFSYASDGSIPQKNMTSEGPGAVDSLNPFAQVEAETIAWESGIETEVCSEGGMNVTSIESGDYIKVEAVEFGSGATSFDARVASASGGGSIELRLDGEDGALVGTCAIDSSGGDAIWTTQSCQVSGAMGEHDLYLKFASGGFKFNWWKFAGPGDPGTGGTGAGGAGGGGGSSTTGGATNAGGTGGTLGSGGTDSGGNSSVGGTVNGATSGGVSAGGAPMQTGGTGALAGGTTSVGGSTSAAMPQATRANDSSSGGCACSAAGARTDWNSAIGMFGLLALRSFRRRRR